MDGDCPFLPEGLHESWRGTVHPEGWPEEWAGPIYWLLRAEVEDEEDEQC